METVTIVVVVKVIAMLLSLRENQERAEVGRRPRDTMWVWIISDSRRQ